MFITEKKLLKLALYFNAFYVFCLFIFLPDGFNFQNFLITSFLVISFFLTIVLTFRNYKSLKDIPKTSKFLFYLLIGYSLIIIIRSFSLSLQDWFTNFGNVYMALAWLTPLYLIIGLKIENWTIMYKAISFMFFLITISFLLHLMGVRRPAEEWNWLLRPTCFIILTAFYRYNLINRLKFLFIIVIYIIVAIITKFRFEFIYLFTVLLFITIDKISSVKLKKSFYRYILIFFLALFILIFTVGYENMSNIALLFVEFQDSRTFLFNELLSELSGPEKLFGRGSLGDYYSDFFERTRKYWNLMGRLTWAGDVPIRNTIEVGYLQMILKGGFLLLIFYSTLSFYAAYLAIFRSNNKFTKRLGFYISIVLILSIISLRPAFEPTFIIFWMAVGTALSKKYRSMTDSEIDNLIKFK